MIRYDSFHWAEPGGSRFDGDDRNDYFLGQDGNDVFHGRGGTDYMSGGGGTDIFSKTGGAAQIHGGPGDDWLSFSGRPLGVGVEMMTGRVDGAGYTPGAFRISGIENVIGSNAADYIRGDGADNVLIGGGGGDHLAGRGGNDQLSGNQGRDVLVASSGRDQLFGGAHADHFMFDFVPGPSLDLAIIEDFDAAEGDLLYLDTAFGLSSLDGDGNGRIDAADAQVHDFGGGLLIDLQRSNSFVFLRDVESLVDESVLFTTIEDPWAMG